jgi:hypothetical protein
LLLSFVPSFNFCTFAHTLFLMHFSVLLSTSVFFVPSFTRSFSVYFALCCFRVLSYILSLLSLCVSLFPSILLLFTVPLNPSLYVFLSSFYIMFSIFYFLVVRGVNDSEFCHHSL